MLALLLSDLSEVYVTPSQTDWAGNAIISPESWYHASPQPSPHHPHTCKQMQEHFAHSHPSDYCCFCGHMVIGCLIHTLSLITSPNIHIQPLSHSLSLSVIFSDCLYFPPSLSLCLSPPLSLSLPRCLSLALWSILSVSSGLIILSVWRPAR